MVKAFYLKVALFTGLAILVCCIGIQQSYTYMTNRVHTSLPVDGKLLTLFTTFKAANIRRHIHKTTLRNWASLDVRPVLFIDNKTQDWTVDATQANWTVRNVPRSGLRHGIPILRHMFKKVQESVTTPFIGFANGDILFDHSLERTLKFILHNISKISAHLLLIGRRRNLELLRHSLGNLEVVETLTKIGNTRLDLFKPFAIDYFITLSRGFEWDKVPDFVIGRVGYDNWLVAHAITWNYTVIDASEVLLAVHQVGDDGLRSGFLTNPGELDINKKLIQGSVEPGWTSCAPFTLTCVPGTTQSVDNDFICPLQLNKRTQVC